MESLKIHFLNTIWSDAIILENNNSFGFIDTGSSFYYPMIEKHLNEYSIYNIDFIILTHFHNDHYGNIYSIIKNYNVKKLYLKHYYGLDGTNSSGYASTEEYIENEFNRYYEILNIAKERNTEIIFIDDFNEDYIDVSFNNINLELYECKNRIYEMYSNPESEFYNEKRFNENFNSIGVFIKVNGYNIFLGGDLTCSSTDIVELKELSLKVINSIYKKHNINHIDIYKSCHHGGGGTNTLQLCNLLKARNVIITNTSKWLDTYNTYDNLKSSYKGVNILKTDYHKYIFSVEEDITYKMIAETSLFITLDKK